MHAGQSETWQELISHPTSFISIAREANPVRIRPPAKLPEDVYTGIWWYTRFPDHYSGDGSVATKALGDFHVNWWIDRW